MTSISNQTLILLSEGYKSLPRLGHLFKKLPTETRIVCITTAINSYKKQWWIKEKNALQHLGVSVTEDNITAAIDFYEKYKWWHKEKAALQHLGFDVVEYDIAGKSKAQVAEALKEAEVIYVTGGNTYYLMAQINRSGFADVLKDRLAAGAIYVGSSAGTVVACPDISFIEDMDDRSITNLPTLHGMGLVGFPIMPHLDHPDFGAIARPLAQKADPTLNMVALNDAQAVLVNGSKFEVLNPLATKDPQQKIMPRP